MILTCFSEPAVADRVAEVAKVAFSATPGAATGVEAVSRTVAPTLKAPFGRTAPAEVALSPAITAAVIELMVRAVAVAEAAVPRAVEPLYACAVIAAPEARAEAASDQVPEARVPFATAAPATPNLTTSLAICSMLRSPHATVAETEVSPSAGAVRVTTGTMSAAFRKVTVFTVFHSPAVRAPSLLASTNAVTSTAEVAEVVCAFRARYETSVAAVEAPATADEVVLTA